MLRKSTQGDKAMLQCVTESVAIEAPPSNVFEFLAQPENMPRWAVRFCKKIRRDGPQWLVTTDRGDMSLVSRAQADSRVVDWTFVPAPGSQATAHARVL